MNELDDIFDADTADIEKLKKAFRWITGRIVEEAQREIELARAMGDRETIVKQQIKMETMKSAWGIFQDCYLRATGRRAWDE